MNLSARFFLRLFERFGGAMLAPKSAVRLVLPNGDERTLGDVHASGSDVAKIDIFNTDMFHKVLRIPEASPRRRMPSPQLTHRHAWPAW